MIDEFSRECLALVVDTSVSGARVTRELTTLLGERGRPLLVVSDNGTELTLVAILPWSQERQGERHHIVRDKPTPNASSESFNGRLRDECLSEMLFTLLAHARAVLAAWRSDYNSVGPHSQLGGCTLARIADQRGAGQASDHVAIPTILKHEPPGLYD